MRIAQRSTSTQFSGANGFVCDRFQCANQTDGAITFSQSTDVPSGQGFINSTKINIDTADTSLAATQHALFQQKVEGYHSSHLMWGTSNAQNVTVSFWIRSSLTGTFTYYFLDESANSQSYVETFTIDAADTWQKIVLNIDAPTTGGTTDFPTTNATSFFTGICLGVGSTHQTSTTGSWHATANFAASTSSAVKLIGTASATMYVTGWQMEVGTLTNPIFEHRSVTEELALCKRYYEVDGHGSNNPNGWNFKSMPVKLAQVGDYIQGTKFAVEKRADPTIVVYSRNGTSGKVSVFSSGSDAANNWSTNAQGVTGFHSVQRDGGSHSAGTGFEYGFTADAEL